MKWQELETYRKIFIMKCNECKHYERLKESDSYLPEDEEGECAEIASQIDIEVTAGFNGGYVSKIEVKHDFFCAAFET